MAHSVPSSMASCSARCHYKQVTRTHHSLSDSMQRALITPLRPLTAPSGAASERLVVKHDATKEKKDLHPAPGRTLNNFRPKVLNRHLKFDLNIKSSMVNEK
ncbi:hypothetical protein E2C01_059850 [Portunus trituberculatus]|uniref:Uncharacterized protein n=1 Tax=Portunus trituberculatus TaxID=210409 RepID=A0A5B7HAF5_PORTR|nr:hypothetical protein [Portunus trituberculatus]